MNLHHTEHQFGSPFSAFILVVFNG